MQPPPPPPPADPPSGQTPPPPPPDADGPTAPADGQPIERGDGDGRPRDPGGPLGGWLSWGFVALFMAFSLVLVTTSQLTPAPVEVQAREVARPSPMMIAAGKGVIAARSESEQGQALRALSMMSQGPADRLRTIIVRADVQDTEEAIASLDALAERLPEDAPLREDTRIVRLALIAGPDAVEPERAEGLVERHGWFGELLLVHGMDDAAPARQQVLQQAEIIHTLNLVVSIGLFVGGGLVVALIVTVIVMLVRRRIRAGYAPPALGGTVFLQSFALFLAAMLLTDAIASLVSPLIGQGALLVRWLALLPALYPLAVGLSGTRLRYALGWHRGRGILREAVAGVLGYITLLPIVAIGLLCTLLLIQLAGMIHSGEDTAAPTHPIGDMLAQASVFEILMIFSLAVVWAPIVEETFFRGALHHHLRGRFGVILTGLISGVIFAAIHPQGILGIPALTSIAICFTLIREWRGSLIGPIAAHAFNNGCIVLLLLFLVL